MAASWGQLNSEQRLPFAYIRQDHSSAVFPTFIILTLQELHETGAEQVGNGVERVARISGECAAIQPMMCTSQRSTLKFSIVTAAVGTQKDNQFKFPGEGYSLRGEAQLYIFSTGIISNNYLKPPPTNLTSDPFPLQMPLLGLWHSSQECSAYRL